MQQNEHQWRISLVIAVFIVALCSLVARMVYLNVINRNFLLSQSKARILRTVTVPAYRGMILDSEGDPLAISTPLESIWINPRIFIATPEKLFLLAKALGVNEFLLKKTLDYPNSKGLL